MQRDKETILDLCLDEIRKGKSIEYCLDLYPEFASELEPLLRLTKDIEETPKPEPRKEAINLTLIKIGEAAAAQRRRKPVFEKWIRRPFVLKPAFAKAIAFVLVLVVAVWSIGAISARSFPGDLLYPLKLATERVQFTLTRSAEGKVELRLTLADRRLEELVKSVEQKGSLNESVLRNLLKEAELALDEAKPVEEEQFALFLARLNYLNDYQQAVFEQLKPRLSAEERKVLDQAIKVCHQRSMCMMDMMHPERPGVKNRRWRHGCRWR
jgi:hypothetical protein